MKIKVGFFFFFQEFDCLKFIIGLRELERLCILSQRSKS